MSRNWINAVQESGRFSEFNVKWDRPMTVEMDTLDNLISQYGRPAFVKIDVEGFEEGVLKGLSQKVIAMSIEFTPEFIENTLACVKHLQSLGDFEYQISLGESMEFHLEKWVSPEKACEALKLIEKTKFGDLYARNLS